MVLRFILVNDMSCRAQVFAIAALLLCLLILAVSSMGVQSSLLKEVEDEGFPLSENILLCFDKIFLKALVQSSIEYNPYVFMRSFTDFQNFVLSFLDRDHTITMDWDGNVTFNWNSTISYTQASLRLHLSCGGISFQRVFYYKFLVNVDEFSWSNGWGEVVFRASINNRPCKVRVNCVYVLINETWVKLSSIKLLFNGSFTFLSFRCMHSPQSFYIIINDENGVVVEVKLDF